MSAFRHLKGENCVGNLESIGGFKVALTMKHSFLINLSKESSS